MNTIEAFFLAVGMLLLWWYLYRQNTKWSALLILAVCVPALWFSIEEVTQFLLIDEPRNLREVVFIHTAPMRQWSQGELRTTDMVLGPILNLLQLFTNYTTETYMMIAKALHWLSGIFVIALIYDLLSTRFISSRDQRVFSVIFWNLMLLSPVTLQAIKFFNYDLLSMLLGTYAILLAIVGFSANNRSYLLAGLIVSFLAGQEKNIASPLLWGMVCVFTYMEVNKIYSKGWKRRLVQALRSLGFTLAIILGIMVISYVILLLNRGGDFPTEYSNLNPVKIFLPVIKILTLAIWVIFGSNFMSGWVSYAKSASPQNLIFLLSGAIVIAVILLAIAVPMVVGITRKIKLKLQILPKKYNRYMQLIYGFFFLMLFFVGVIATYKIRPYISPAKPILPGAYVPPTCFNNFITHFGQKTYIRHIIYQIGFAYSVFFNIISTTVIFLAITLYMFLGKRKSHKGKYILFILSGSSLWVPLMYGIAQIPLAGRYFNLFIFLSLTALSVGITSFISRWKNKVKTLVIGTIIIMLIVEIIPFRASYMSFRPWWSNYSKQYHKKPYVGEINSWGFGGDIVMRAGKKIDQKQKGVPARLYYHYYGQWLGNKTNIEVIDMTDTNVVFRYTENDYYILDRCSITQGWLWCPHNVQPIMTISYRGFNQAWIFRGDQLASVGFQF